jgi:very-short-patch-repair endonuclease/predicted transcriptional regulator of viral defense system
VGDESYFDHAIGGKSRVRPGAGIEAADSAIALIASRQYGVVSRRQLLERGVGRRAIDHRLAAGRPHPIHRGVYAVGHRALTLNARWLAAVLAGGAAALSDQAACATWALTAYSGRPHVTVPRWKRPQPGVTWHCSPLPPDEVTRLDGIPITTVARTLLDLAAILDRQRLAKAINEAEVRGLSDRLSLPALLERYPHRRGTRSLRAILADHRIGLDIPRKDLEIEFLSLIDRRRLPRPEVNAWLTFGDRSFEVDCLWRAARLIVELDGRAVHGTAAAFEADRERDRLLLANGWRVMRVTWRQLMNDPGGVARDVRAALGAAPRDKRNPHNALGAV